ncbi:Mut7-C RNAse domain-containing protein [Phenylobacterium sp. J367]|uniref:Mut7-C RNAse domain-containing protein n=1 Tax=Phenylobacterium sp. J367 TaxID=2898435 RepID=UPI002150FB7F|nr:Mut7-C RNAse domain-containing protein [Phenylobacterium sp. J367]MCR5878647.1 Mut7-C RNAse domain-containing protein [Phenylobacterium sp. J367]
MRFLCDEMLVRLARLLRAAGYDTYLAAGGEKDAALLHLAREEGRQLLTRDRRLAEAAQPDSVRITGFGPEQEARRLSEAVLIDWDFAPFTRCVMDNAPLRPASLDQIDRMPPRAQALAGPFRACPACGRLYWPGSHARRMADRFRGIARPYS